MMTGGEAETMTARGAAHEPGAGALMELEATKEPQRPDRDCQADGSSKATGGAWIWTLGRPCSSSHRPACATPSVAPSLCLQWNVILKKSRTLVFQGCIQASSCLSNLPSTPPPAHPFHATDSCDSFILTLPAIAQGDPLHSVDTHTSLNSTATRHPIQAPTGTGSET